MQCNKLSAFGRALAAMIRETRLREDRGAALVEFAFALPVLMAMLVGMFVFGIAINNYLAVTNAAQVGATQLSISRGSSAPYTNTVNAIYGAAPTLQPSSLTIKLAVNGAACATDAACQTALGSAMGQSATVTVSYPCSLSVMGVAYLQSCSLKANPTGRIQ